MSDLNLLPKRAVAKEFGISTRTVDRWHHDESLGFPAPIIINKRCYFSQGAIEKFKNDCARRTASSNAVAA